MNYTKYTMKYAKHTLRNAKHEPSRGSGACPPGKFLKNNFLRLNLVQIWTENLLEINLSKSYLLHFSKLIVSMVIAIILCDVFLQ